MRSSQEKQLESKARTVLKKLHEAKEIQKIIVKNKKFPKKFRINNELNEIDYFFRTKLFELSDDEAIELLKTRQLLEEKDFSALNQTRI